MQELPAQSMQSMFIYEPVQFIYILPAEEDYTFFMLTLLFLTQHLYILSAFLNFKLVS